MGRRASVSAKPRRNMRTLLLRWGGWEWFLKHIK
jgi:hypothetical protein